MPAIVAVPCGLAPAIRTSTVKAAARASEIVAPLRVAPGTSAASAAAIVSALSPACAIRS